MAYIHQLVFEQEKCKQNLGNNNTSLIFAIVVTKFPIVATSKGIALPVNAS